MAVYDQSKFYIDFSGYTNLSDIEKTSLENIQKMYRPIERVEFLIEFRVQNKITSDEFETMTGLAYNFGN